MRTGQLEVRYLASPLAHARVGVIVPRHGHTAVERNVVTRRLRELARRELLPALSAIDVVIRAAPSAYAASFDRWRMALQKAAAQLPKVPRATGDDVPATPPNAARGDVP